MVLAAYVLHLVGSIAGLPSIAGLILNYMRQGKSGSVLASHHRWMIRSFWWAMPGLVLGVLTVFFLIGWVFLGLTWLWYVYRHVRGLIDLINGKAMPG
jgi:uncharacterized membrane protein